MGQAQIICIFPLPPPRLKPRWSATTSFMLLPNPTTPLGALMDKIEYGSIKFFSEGLLQSEINGWLKFMWYFSKFCSFCHDSWQQMSWNSLKELRDMYAIYFLNSGRLDNVNGEELFSRTQDSQWNSLFSWIDLSYAPKLWNHCHLACWIFVELLVVSGRLYVFKFISQMTLWMRIL